MFAPTAFGKYHLFEKIAVGGMAELYKAKIFGAAGFEKLMVVKQILPQYAQDPDFVKMFINEAKIAVSLSHGNIVPIYELGKIDGVYFIAMEYIDGQNLGEIMERAHESGHPVPIEIALFIAGEICKGLDYAHRKTGPEGSPLHIIHRDISPQNILVSYDGEVKIVDFGIAKAIHSSQTTKAGVIKGKFGYMSPEQAKGQTLDSRTDVFSAGILLFEMLTGSRLFSSDSEVETLENVRMAKVPSPSRLNPRIPPMLDKLVFKALAKDRQDRYQSADDFRKALSKFVYSQGWEVSHHALASYMGTIFPADSRGEREGASMPVEAETRPATPTAGTKEPVMAGEKDRDATPTRDDAPTRRVAVDEISKQESARSDEEPTVSSKPGKAPLVGPPELESLLEGDDGKPAPPADTAAQASLLEAPEEISRPAPPPKKARTSPGFELAQEEPDKEPTGVIEAAQEIPLGDAALMLGQGGVPAGSSGDIPPPEIAPGPPQRRSMAVPVLAITVVILLVVIGFLIAKFAPTLSPTEKKKRALAEQERLLKERDKNAPVYGRVEFFIEPVAVDFFWNGQRHPQSPTKHVQIRDLDIKKIYKVKLVAERKPDEKSMMWFPKHLTLTPQDWKVIEGIHMFRKTITMDPTPENKEAIKELEAERKAKEALERRRRRLGLR